MITFATAMLILMSFNNETSLISIIFLFKLLPVSILTHCGYTSLVLLFAIGRKQTVNEVRHSYKYKYLFKVTTTQDQSNYFTHKQVSLPRMVANIVSFFIKGIPTSSIISESPVKDYKEVDSSLTDRGQLTTVSMGA